jgi:hypothetical protein
MRADSAESAMREDDHGCRACVIISHYNAWSSDNLVRLLDQLKEVPAGHAFHVRVVVNRAVDRPTALPERHANVEVIERPNQGYNIGAWEHGWRRLPSFDFYLFLQEECRVLRPGWLRAFLRTAEDPRVGLVGEIAAWDRPWAELEATKVGQADEIMRRSQPGIRPSSSTPNFFRFLDEQFLRLGIERGRTGRHLQSVVLAARREVLEAIGGFPTGNTYCEAVASEIAISKLVLSRGLKVEQVGWLSFSYILHPQWDVSLIRRVMRQTALPWIPSPIRKRLLLTLAAIRSAARRIRARGGGVLR